MYFCENGYQVNNIPEPFDSEGVLKHIENIGRICYRSHDRTSEGSDVRFVTMLRNNKHWAMLEHYIFVMRIPLIMADEILDLLYTTENTEFIRCMKYINITDDDYPYTKLISGSATAFNYLWQTNTVRHHATSALGQICQFLKSRHPHLMVDPNNTEDLEYSSDIELLTLKEINDLSANLRWIHKWMSVHFIVERSSAIDLVRHRPASYAQESTRYCNYAEKGLCFIIPTWLPSHDQSILKSNESVDKTLLWKAQNPCNMSELGKQWLNAINDAANTYIKLVNDPKVKPEDAKSVLPHCLRAELNITAQMCEWYHIFEMRADSHAFPAIQSVMVPLLNECISNDPEIFNPLQHLVEEGAKYIAKVETT